MLFADTTSGGCQGLGEEEIDADDSNVDNLRTKAFDKFMSALEDGSLDDVMEYAAGQKDDDQVLDEIHGIDDLRSMAFAKMMDALNSGQLDSIMVEATGNPASQADPATVEKLKRQVEQLQADPEIVDRLKRQVQQLTTTLAQLTQENNFLRNENASLKANNGDSCQLPAAGSAVRAVRASQDGA
jgi:hypothetical protein